MPAKTNAVIDPARLGLLRKVGEKTGHDLVRELAELYLERSPRNLAEIRRALAEPDLATVRRLAHSLKGSSSNLGAGAMAALAARLEGHAEAGALDECRRELEAVTEEHERVGAALRHLLGGREPDP